MPDQRIKGQEISVLIVRDGSLETELTDIQSFDIEPMLEILSQGYLGEKTERKDEIFKGVKFKLEMHLHKQDWFDFLAAVLDRAKRNTPDIAINISSVLAFPNGETPTILLKDVKFGPMPHNVAGRGEYFKIGVEGEVEDLEVQKS